MFDVASAITFNQTAGFPGYIVRGIRTAVNAPDGETWDTAGVVAVYAWQASNGLSADGKVGSKTIGKLLDAMLAGWHFIDAAALKAWWEYKKSNQPAPAPATISTGDPDGVVKSFHQPTVLKPFKFRRGRDIDKTTGNLCDFWGAGGSFQVDVRLNPKLSADELYRYEYRQFISGRVLVQDGSWNNNRSQWTPGAGPIRDFASAFEIPEDKKAGLPAGLTPQMKEDGLITVSKTVYRFGRRNSVLTKPGFTNAWSPGPGGPNFRLVDSPGVFDVYKPTSAPKVQMWFEFRGEVIEVEDPDAEESDRKVLRVLAAWNWRTPPLNDVLKWWEAKAD